jgi:hypothetical protein
MRNMKRLWRGTGSAFALAVVTVATPPATMRGPDPQMPFGWGAAMDVSGEYSVRADVSRRLGGSGFVTGTISSTVDEPRKSAFMLQSIRADLYRGKRLRLTGYLKTNITTVGQAGLFVRVDGRDSVQVADYMIGRLIQTTKDWEQYSVVLDVPNNAVGITFGFHFTGTGQAWMDDASIETVDPEVAITVDNRFLPFVGLPVAGSRSLWELYRRAPLRPINLNFEQTRSIVTH